MKINIQTDQAPAAIGTYSQAIKIDNTVYLSRQIPLDPKTGELVKGDIHTQLKRIFENLKAVAEAAGGGLDAIVRICVYLTDFANFPAVNEVMAQYFKTPYPARTTIGVASLPKGAVVEIDAVMMVGS